MNVLPLHEPTDPAAAAHAATRRLPAFQAAGVPTRIDLVLVGARGQVGSALRRQLGARQDWLRDHAGLDLKLIAAFDRRGLAHDLQGLSLQALQGDLPARREPDVELLLARLLRPGGEPTLLIDCTASDEVADWYPRLLGNGVGIVAANKRANARSLTGYRQLQRLSRQHRAPYRYETTVGAAIPVLGPIRDLRLRGERITSLQGVLSGSLSHVLHRLQEGCAFSVAVAEAAALGLTEPDPLEDLRARDLARKLLVLGREAGFDLEAEAVEVDSLVDEAAAAHGDAASLLAAQDARGRPRATRAPATGARLVMLVEVDAHGARVGVRSLPADSPFAALKPGENL
jgi:aspartokinase/homoserine dehydrogenase 1